MAAKIVFLLSFMGCVQLFVLAYALFSSYSCHHYKSARETILDSSVTPQSNVNLIAEKRKAQNERFEQGRTTALGLRKERERIEEVEWKRRQLFEEEYVVRKTHSDCMDWFLSLPRSLYSPRYLQEAVVFWHLPKCSGTFFEDMFMKEKPVMKSVKKGHPDFTELTTTFGRRARERGFKPIYILMLRDAVQRVKSEYFHGVRNNQTNNPFFLTWDRNSVYYFPKFRLRAKSANPAFSFKDFVEYAHNLPANNRQTRFVSGFAPMDKNIYDNDFSYFLEKVGNDPAKSKQMLEMAKSNLLQIDFVGLAHRFEDTLELLAYSLNWPHVLLPRQNKYTTNWTDSEDQGDIELVKKHNQLDLELVSFAEQRFDEQLSKLRMCKEILSKYEQAHKLL